MADDEPLQEAVDTEEIAVADTEASDIAPNDDKALDSEPLDVASETPQLNDLEELPVELVFVADQIKMPLKEVEQIKPGYVMTLNKAVGQVEIRANGAIVGVGELVQIENRAGVRILKLYQQNEAE